MLLDGPAAPVFHPVPDRAVRLERIHLIALMCTLSHSGFGGSRVAISLYSLELGASQLTIGVMMALYAIFPLLLAVWVGRFADRVGPRRPMLIGCTGVVVGL